MPSRRARTSALWGVIGALSFLVLVQGYELAVGTPLGFGPKLGVALVVGVAAAGLTYVAEDHLPTPERKR